MSKNLRETALRHAIRHGSEGLAYSNGATVLLVLGARERDGRIEGLVTEHRCGSSGAAHKVAERIWQVWAAFPHLSPHRRRALGSDAKDGTDVMDRLKAGTSPSACSSADLIWGSDDEVGIQHGPRELHGNVRNS